MSAESQPAVPGTYYGELSPAGQWFWNGTGQPGDSWVANPANVPVQQALPLAKGAHHLILPAVEAAILIDHTGHLGPKGETLTIGHCQIMNPADLIKAFGLTG